jgi:hypothetical protein
MNGVHCQISEASTDISGSEVSQSGWGGLSLPNKLHIQVSEPLIRPYVALYRACFHSRAEATGTTRNGVISMVRTMLRPRNWRSRSRARPRPRTRLTRTTLTVRMTVVSREERSCGSVTAAV